MSDHAKLKQYKIVAGLAMFLGWAAVTCSMEALLGTPGIGIAIGIPLMLWGWWTAVTVIQAEVGWE